MISLANIYFVLCDNYNRTKVFCQVFLRKKVCNYFIKIEKASINLFSYFSQKIKGIVFTIPFITNAIKIIY